MNLQLEVEGGMLNVVRLGVKHRRRRNSGWRWMRRSIKGGEGVVIGTL